MAMVLMPEFHTLGSPLALGQRAPPPPVVLEEPRSYKALVMIFMNGGAGRVLPLADLELLALSE